MCKSHASLSRSRCSSLLVRRVVVHRDGTRFRGTGWSVSSKAYWMNDFSSVIAVEEVLAGFAMVRKGVKKTIVRNHRGNTCRVVS